MWLLKPTGLNRGRGIHVFKDLHTLKNLLKEYCEGVERGENPQENNFEEDEKEMAKKRGPHYMIKQSAFVVQKYIERPLLINNRKFDIRVWVLVDHKYDVYFFKEGYLRTSSSEYNPNNTDDLFVHLTNYAVQKYANNYGTYEDGNQLTFPQFAEILQK